MYEWKRLITVGIYLVMCLRLWTLRTTFLNCVCFTHIACWQYKAIYLPMLGPGTRRSCPTTSSQEVTQPDCVVCQCGASKNFITKQQRSEKHWHVTNNTVATPCNDFYIDDIIHIWNNFSLQHCAYERMFLQTWTL